MEIKVIMASEGAIDLKAKASGLSQERTTYALSRWQLTCFGIHVRHKGLVNASLRAMQQIEGIGSEWRRGIFCDKGDRESGQSINRQGLSS